MLDQHIAARAGFTPEQLHSIQRRTVWVLAVATILGGLGVGAALSVGALLLAEVSGSEAISGLASAMFGAGAATAGIPLARIAAKHGRRRALVMGSLIAMLGSVVAIVGSATAQWIVLAVGIGMVGVASAVQLLSRFAATDLALPKNRARDLSLVVWSITLGAVVGPNLLGPGALVGELLDLTPLAGVFVFPFFAQALAALITWRGLRPDPWLTARQLQGGLPVSGEVSPVTRATATGASRVPQVLTIVVIALAQAIMVGLMAMTPLHLMRHDGTPELVGITLSLHIAGMYALSPVFGYLAGRIGRLTVITLGWIILLVSVVLAYLAGESHAMVQVALVMLGLGWGAITVAGAALLTEITAAHERPKWQGRSDTIMSASGALAGVLSGVIFALGDFSFLAIFAGGMLALGAVASIWLGLRPAREY